MLSVNEKISLRQLQALIIISAMGTGVIVLPRRVAEYAGSDGWMIALGLTLLAMAIGALVVTAARLRPSSTFIESTGFFLTRPVAFVLGAVLWAKLVLTAGLELRAFLLVVNEVLLTHTPIPLTGAIMLALAAYAAVKGIETRARVAEVLLVLMVLPLAFLLVLALIDTDWSNLQPVLTTPPRTLACGTLRLGFMFAGLECLLLVSPYIHPRKKMCKAVVSALGVAGLVITVITVLTLAKFGRGVIDRPWPVLAMMDMLALPGAFIERQEALVFSFWIVTTFALVNALVFFGGVLIKDCLSRKSQTAAPIETYGRACHETRDKSHPSRANRKWQIGVLISAVVVYAVTMIPWDETDIYNRLDFLSLTTGVFFLVVLPIILILASKLRGSKHLVLLILAGVTLGGLAGCYDKVEIEDRAFVVAIAIDKAEDENERYAVTLSLPAALDGGKAEDEDEPQHLKKASGKTVTEAINKINADNNTQLYFGQTKLLTLGSDLLKDPELVSGALDAIDRHPQIARQIHIIAACGKAADILKANPPGEALPGQYVAAIYRDKRKIGGTSFLMNLELLTTQLKYTNGALIPAMEADDDELNLSGAAVIKNSRKIGQLNEDELRGYLWCIADGGQGAIVTAEVEKHPIPFAVEMHKANVRFKENENSLQAHIYVELTGRVDEFASGSSLLARHNFRAHVQQKLASTVADEIVQSASKMQNDFALDSYNWLETMRKKQYPMYQRYAATWGDTFTNLEVIPHVTVVVKS